MAAPVEACRVVAEAPIKIERIKPGHPALVATG